MGFIYKITNNINNKVYIGKTQNTIEYRWKEHIQDSKKDRNNKRPLYDAINKYGIENFIIEKIEECNNFLLAEREKYWIEYYNSYYNGYNATLGGDGAFYADYELIYNLWLEGKSSGDIREITNYDFDTIHRALNTYDILEEDIIKRGREKFSQKVAQIDPKTGDILNIFDSQIKAALFLGKSKNSGGTIGRACRGERNIAFGYKWKYV